MHIAPAASLGRFVRPLVAFLAAFALMFVPLAAHAEDINGTPGDDPSISGTNNNDNINGGSGSDTINGRGGADTIDGDGDNVASGVFAVATRDGESDNDNIDGGAGHDVINGDGDNVAEGTSSTAVYSAGDDIINGGAGNDTINGDGNNSANGVDVQATLNGGDDIINGGAGNDTIHGDGTNTASGIATATLNGGSDFINGDAGDDTIFGDGGDDGLYGGTGTDTLYGGAGFDFLCGSDVDRQDDGVVDILTGGVDPDLACPIDDEATVTSGAETVLALAANDDKLTDENEEESAVYYLLEFVPAGISAVIHAITGALTFTATQSGVIQYSVNRGTLEEQGFRMGSFAEVFITVLQEEDPDDDDENSDDEDSDDEDSDENEDSDSDSDGAAVLPDTGAADNLQLIGGTGIALTILGIFTLVANPRRRPGAHRA